MKRRLTKIAAGIALIVASVAYGLWSDYRQFVEAPLAIPPDGIVYEIPAGASLRTVANGLAAQGVIEHPRYLEWLARHGETATRIQAGEYRLEPGLTPVSLLALLGSGRTVQYGLTIPEGWTFRQMMAAVGDHAHLVQTIDPADHGTIMTRLGEPDAHPEGWFYPDTWHFPKGTTDLDFLRRAHERMKAVLEREWAGRNPGLPLKTPYEALILASIVEKETAVPEERPLIAAVFASRMKKGMRLQTDPTVIYGIEAFDGNLRRRDLEADTPYNTYTRAGLPPTPIALPGGDAIHAVLHPAETKALYFVARGDGSHHFSETYEEHRRAVIRYQLGGNGNRYGRGG